MKTYLKYIIVLFFMLFSFYYTDKVIELSNYNNTILTSINDYASGYDTECREGFINEDGIVLGLSGISVDVNRSYSNMKGIGFKKELIEYKKDKCILNKEDNKDKYIIAGSNYKNSVSLVIDLITFDYLDEFKRISNKENIELNYLVNINNIGRVDKNILIKTNSNNIKEFKKKNKEFYCVKYNSFEVLDYCKKESISSIKMINYIDSDLLYNTKKILDKGIIIFIKENSFNLNEFYSTIKYIKSRGYKIVSINDLLS